MINSPLSAFSRQQSKSKTLIFALVLVFAALFAGSCQGENGEDSPFSEILSREPFAPLSDSIRLDPRNDELYFRRAVLLNKNNFPEPALADFQKAWSLRRNEKYAFAITNAWIDKRPDSAIRFLKGALEDFPQSYLLKISLARAYNKIDQTDDALRVCADLLQSMPELTDVWMLQSQLYDRKGDDMKSRQSMEKAHALQPDNLSITSDLAYKYAESKDPRAIVLCDSLIARDSLQLFEQPYYVKGIYYSNTNDKSRAMHFFDETIKRNHNYLSAYIEKGRILLEQKKLREAFNAFQLANTIRPAYPDAWYWMAVCQEQLGQKEDAFLNYQKAYSLDKTFTQARDAAARLSK